MNQVDARGYSCPQPVIMTKSALAKGAPLTVLVDNMTAVNNIMRFAQNNKHMVEYKEVDGDYEITIK